MEINLTTFRELADLGPLRNALRATRTMKRQNEKVISVPQLSTSEIEEQVKSYQNWLTADAEYNLAQRQSNDRLEYIEAAQQTVKLGSRTIRAFAPFNYDVSAVTTITKNQRIVVGIVLLTIAIGLILFGWYMLSLLIAALTVFYFGNLILTLGLSAKTLDEQVELNIEDEVVHALADAEWPRYTILCPLYKEAAVVPQFAEAMGELDYPIDKLQILFLTEEDDNETREAILAQELPSHFQIVVVPDGEPRTKPRACNYGLLMADGDYLVIFDAEDKPDPLQLKKAVLAFANCGPELGCVQAKLNFYNPTQNVLTRWFTAEYSAWFDTTLPGLQWANLSLPLGGTSNHFRTSTLTTLGAWDPFNVTEDCDLGLRLARLGFKTVVLASTTLEEANPDPKNWIRQRSRWIKGYMQTFLVHMRQPERYLPRERWRDLFSLQLIVGARTSILLINPIMWALLIIYVIFRPFVEDTYHILFPGLILYMAVLCLIFGNLLYIYVHFIGCLKRGEYNLVKWTLIMPIYWAMGSYAAYKALHQLITKPHYWEKTAHGLHLPNAHAAKPAPREPVSLNPMGSMQLAYGFAAGEPQPVLAPENDINRSRMAKYQTTVMAVKTMSTPAVGIQRTLNFAGATALPSLGGGRGYGLRLSKYRTAVMSLQAPLALAPSGEAQSAVLMPTRIQQRVVSRPKTSLAARVLGDRWLTILALVTVALSIGSTYYYLITNKILTYTDALSHLMIARRVFDNETPGLAQLGGIWLPLPHVLMFPFVGNDYLWRTGLAGSLVGMICYFLAVIFLFLTARRITKNSVASFIGTLLFALNPNVLYMQSTPMSELVYFAMLCGTCFFYVAWIQDDDPKQLILAGILVFLATLSRYDGWPVAIALIGLTPVITIIRHRHFARAEAYTIILAIIALFGVALWMLWCALIFRDPLYFQRSEFSAQAQQIQFLNNGLLFTYKNVFQSLRYFGLAGLRVSGALTVVLGALGCVAWILQTLWHLVWKRSLQLEIVGAIIVFVPIAFNVYALYQGQTIIYLPEALPPGVAPAFFNTRYGLGLLPLAALAFPILCNWLLRLLKSRNIGLSLGRTVLVLATVSIIAFQNRVLAVTDIITLRDPMVGACQTSSHNILEYLSTHYNGGLILGTAYGASPVYLMGPALGIPFRNIVYEGNNVVWDEVLAHPADHVDWVMVNPTTSSDLVARALKVNDPSFQSAFNLVATDANGYQLYRRHDALDVPRVATPNRALYQLDYCKSVS